MKNSKKGFTLVELLVVIAILAILATVAVVGYTSFITKANESADIQAVAQMNTVLSADGAVTPTTQGRLFEVLAQAGMKAENYRPLIEGRYFYWDKGLNRILYVDEKGNVIYPENVTSTGKWYSLSGEINTEGGKDYSNTDLNATTITLEIASGADFVKAAEFINAQSSALGSKTVEIVLSDDINLMGADVCFADKATANLNVVFKSDVAGTQRTISGLYISDAHSTYGHDADGNASNTYGHSLFLNIKNLTVENIKIADSTIGGLASSQSGFFTGTFTGTAKFTNVVVEDCDVYGKNKVGTLVGYAQGKMILTNVDILRCNVYAAYGEAGALFGVALKNGAATNETLITVDATSSVTDCKVELIAGSKIVTIKDKDGNEHVVVEERSNKWRNTTANIGFIGNKDTDNVHATGAFAGYQQINTLAELAAIKGLATPAN